MQHHAIPCNTMQYHAIQCNTMQYHAIAGNTMQYYTIQCNTIQYHASLITADGAYHCPVGSIMAIFDLSQLVKMKMMKMKVTMMFRLRPNLPKRVSQKKRFLKFSAKKRISRDIRIGIRHQSYLRQMDFYSHVKEH